MNIIRSLATTAVVAFLALPLAAHGGYYRGPGDPTPGGPGGPGPGTGGGAGGPGTGDGSSDLSRWQIWWEFNKDPLLQLKAAVHAAPAQTGGDTIFAGADGRPGDARLKPSLADRRDVILPALVRVLERSDNRDLATACMVAIAKIGLEPEGRPESVLALLAARLREKDQEVRETAALALGLSGLPNAQRDLIEILGNTAAGQKLTARPKVDDRTR